MPTEPKSAWSARFAGAMLLVLGLLPVVNWIPGGESAPWFAAVVEEWVAGAGIVVGVAIVLAIISRRLPSAWPERAGIALGTRFDPARPLALACIAGTALLAYGAVAWLVFDGRPLHIDEIVQVLQARTFAAGRLWMPTAADPAFRSIINVVDTGEKVFAQFPPGGPAMLAFGELVGATWLVGPLCAAASVVLYGRLAAAMEPRPGVRLGALLLFAFAPFTAFMAGSYMNHVTALMWLLVGVLGTVAALQTAASRPLAAALSGIGFGCAAAIRPVDALAFAVPAGAWYLLVSLRDRRRVADMTAAALGLAVPFGALLWANTQMTGHPLQFGYQLLWGADHGLGFHAAPWGVGHTPARGLELISLYLLRLQTHLFEFPIPSLLPAALALLLSRRLGAADRYLLVASAALLGAYFAYWHDGSYLGPRFLYPLIPALALWTARLPSEVRERVGATLVYRATGYGLAICVALALFTGLPLRARQYGSALLTMRWNADSAAAAAGVRNAFVLVRESWGAQLIVRMWALGVSHPDADRLYGSVDACVLETALTAVEQAVATDPAAKAGATARLALLTADSARLVASPFSPDTTQRYLPGAAYSSRCRARVLEDRNGFTLLAPLLLARGHGNRYVRDLHERNAALLDPGSDRAVYLLRKAPDLDSVPTFHRVSVDSLAQAYGAQPGTAVRRARFGTRPR